MTSTITLGSVAATVYKPLALDTSTGFATSIPDGGILDIGGVAGPMFTVGGRALKFMDGSSTGDPNSSVVLPHRHAATDIDIAVGSIPRFTGSPRTAQTTLEFLDISINSIDSRLSIVTATVDHMLLAGSSAEGRTFHFAEPLTEWVVEHNKNSKNFIYVLFDETDHEFIPDSVQIVDANTIVVKMTAPQKGRLNIVFYSTN